MCYTSCNSEFLGKGAGFHVGLVELLYLSEVVPLLNHLFDTANINVFFWYLILRFMTFKIWF
jgi:hypothetical protein